MKIPGAARSGVFDELLDRRLAFLKDGSESLELVHLVCENGDDGFVALQDVRPYPEGYFACQIMDEIGPRHRRSGGFGYLWPPRRDFGAKLTRLIDEESNIL